MQSYVVSRLLKVAQSSTMTSRHATAITCGKRLLTMDTNCSLPAGELIDAADNIRVTQGNSSKKYERCNYKQTSNLTKDIKVSCNTRNVKDVKDIHRLKDIIKRNGLVLARHAEENALDRYKKLIERTGVRYTTRKLHLTVIRINAKGELMESKPCSHCVTVLCNYGIRKVTYSTKDGRLITESLQTIISQPSVGYRSADRALDMLDEMLAYYDTSYTK